MKQLKILPAKRWCLHAARPKEAPVAEPRLEARNHGYNPEENIGNTKHKGSKDYV